MRPVLAILLALMFLPVSQAAYGYGDPAFHQFDAPNTLPQWDAAGEPTIGIPWNTNTVFYQAGESTYRIRFDDRGIPAWEDVTPGGLASQQNVDPMLHGDPDTGRVFAGGLQGACSFMAYTDDDGETWGQTRNMCSGAQFDHQSIGSGPWAGESPIGASWEHATYYCAQSGARTGCTTSLDGGITWGPVQQVTGGCGGLHGHIRVSRATGTAVVPHRGRCDDFSGTGAFLGDHHGFAITEDNGVSWQSRFTPISAQGNGHDPSAQFSRDSGWLYYGTANADGAHVALSKDEGVTWETIGGGVGAPAEALDVGQFHDPPVVIADFADVQAGDDDRVAFSFLGVEDSDGDGAADEYPEDPFAECHPPDEGFEQMLWYYFVATSYDGGSTWTVTKVSHDPVQVGGIWQGQTAGEDELCRNLLDFNDMDIDSTGRIHISFADGCVEQCVADPYNARGDSSGTEDDAEGFRTARAALIRQTDGPGLFAAYDVAPPAPTTDPDIDGDGIPDHLDGDIDGDDIPNDEDPEPTTAKDKGIPAPGVLPLLMALAAAVVLRRRP